MNRIEKKEMAPDAAKYFKQELLEIMPDAPLEKVCSLVNDYIYYQQDDLSRDEAYAVIEETCLNV